MPVYIWGEKDLSDFPIGQIWPKILLSLRGPCTNRGSCVAEPKNARFFSIPLLWALKGKVIYLILPMTRWSTQNYPSRSRLKLNCVCMCLGSISGRVIPKTLKIVLDTSLLNTQQYKVRIKGKVNQSREKE